VQSIVIGLSVCLSTRISRKLHSRTSPIFSMHVAPGRGSCSSSTVLCTSGFVDDDMFSPDMCMLLSDESGAA